MVAIGTSEVRVGSGSGSMVEVDDMMFVVRASLVIVAVSVRSDVSSVACKLCN